MGRNLSPVLRRELANLDKDADSRKSAMKVLKSYVKDLDSKAIPLFLAKVSETKDTGSLSGEFTISLYEVLARVHGPNIVPQIDSIMATIVKTLASSAGSFPLQQACSKVVPAIARYGIDPSTPEQKRRHIIHSLCKPLSDSLLRKPECLAFGAALCLKALVDSDNWRFASDGMVNKVCQNVAGALGQKSTQTNSHMCLVMSLAKHNALIVEVYGRLLIQSGLQILDAGVVEGNSQKRLSAIQMVNFIMKCLDPRSIFSELDVVIRKMEKCQSDQMAYVKGAAFEALQTARKIIAEKGSKLEKISASISGSNSGRKDCNGRRNTWSADDRSPTSVSPESQTFDSFVEEYDSLAESPITRVQLFSHDIGHDCRSVNGKLRSYEDGVVDMSLKDGLFSNISSESSLYTAYTDQWRHCRLTGSDKVHDEEFARFSQSQYNEPSRSTTSSPAQSQFNISFGGNGSFTTPQRLTRSVQDPNEFCSVSSVRKTNKFGSPSSRKAQFSPAVYNQNCFSHNVKYEDSTNEDFLAGCEQVQGGSESVSSTDDMPAEANVQKTDEVVPKDTIECQHLATEKSHWKMLIRIAFGLFFVLLPIIISFMLSDGPDEGYHLVPT